MRKPYSHVCIFIIVLLCVMLQGSLRVLAAGSSSEKWRETRSYPLQYGDEELMSMPFQEQLDLLNPPLDLLSEFTTEELANLIMKSATCLRTGCFFSHFHGCSCPYASRLFVPFLYNPWIEIKSDINICITIIRKAK
ncbi:MAG: hypothetical protein IKO41_13795 [Lachnospiraceae bacterium]|nr:hypothetical protein [Lachnospiraceae bacterium]